LVFLCALGDISFNLATPFSLLHLKRKVMCWRFHFRLPDYSKRGKPNRISLFYTVPSSHFGFQDTASLPDAVEVVWKEGQEHMNPSLFVKPNPPDMLDGICRPV